MLRDCLNSVPTGASSLAYEIIVVDNNSSDRTCEELRESHPNVKVIYNDTNNGFAKACNQGIRASLGRYVLLLNPDTLVEDGALQETVEYMDETPNLAAAGCRIIRPDGTLDPSCKRDFPSPWDAFSRMVGLSRLFPRSRFFSSYDACHIDETKKQEIPLIDGCYMMLRRSAVTDIGLFDEQFFMYAEEMDWCKRAHMKGWSIGYDPEATITHMKGEITRHSTFRMLFHFHRSMALYYRKHYGLWNPAGLIVYPGIAARMTLLMLWSLFRKNRRVSG
jgi:GT2 family glycosyltransferase